MPANAKITASALIRYCFAQAPERQRIIQEFRDAEFPVFKGWYGETEGAIRRYVASPDASDRSLTDLEAVLEKRPATSDFEESRILKQLEALEAARNLDLSPLKLSGTVALLEDTLTPLELQGVRVSVRPTNIVKRSRLGFRDPLIGVIKPYISTSNPLSPESAALLGALLHWYAELHLSHAGEADPTLCFVIDVFQRRVFTAPRSFKKRRDLLLYSCQEIAERWNTVPSRVRLTPRTTKTK